MKWNLKVDIEQKQNFHLLHHEDKLLMLGSCFSEHISRKLKRYKFSLIDNPFGILYNPKSIFTALDRIIHHRLYSVEDLNQQEDIYFSYDHHSRFNGHDKFEVLQNMNSEIEQAHQFLKVAHTLVITFGTAYYYKLKKEDRTVGNCHKTASDHFIRVRDNSNSIIESYKSLINSIKLINPTIQFIFTISPVRHWKNGAADNNWSKSILNDAVRTLGEMDEFVHYFPSYEIMMDELRDYRFYEEDLIHPNQAAVNYIWQRFQESCLDSSTHDLIDQIKQIIKASEHKPFNFNSQQHQQFIESIDLKANQIMRINSHIDFTNELKLLYSNMH